jgi:nicotinamidase/pyrazinamidase
MTPAGAPPIDRERSALLVVDVQPDFMPGGALPVAEGDQVVRPIRDLLESGLFRIAVATQDWHPRDHVSFASQHPGHRPYDTITLYGEPQTLWPDHCVAGTAGAALHAGLPTDRLRAIVRKGTDREADSYSGFRNNYDSAHERRPTGLSGYLRECGVRAVYICGLTRDYCVCWSALDAADSGFATTVIWDLTRPVSASSDAAIERRLRARGIAITHAGALRGRMRV